MNLDFWGKENKQQNLFLLFSVFVYVFSSSFACCSKGQRKFEGSGGGLLPAVEGHSPE